MGRRATIVASYVTDIRAVTGIANVTRSAQLPTEIAQTRWPHVGVWLAGETWSHQEGPNRVMADLDVVVDLYVRRGSEGDVFTAADDLIDGICGALYANPSRGGIAVHTSVKQISQAELEDQTIAQIRIVTAVRYRRAPGAS